MKTDDNIVDVVDESTTKLVAFWCSACDADIKREQQRLGSIEYAQRYSTKEKLFNDVEGRESSALNSNIDINLFLTLSLLLLLLAQFRSIFEEYRPIKRYISTFNCKGLKISDLYLFTALKLSTGKAYNGNLYI